MKAALALILIYIGTFLVAIQGASNSSVEASEQGGVPAASAMDPVKAKDIGALLELVGERDTIQETATLATERYRQKVVEASASSERAQELTNTYLSEFHKKFDADAATAQLVGIYDKHFSDDEIRGLLEFYGSPLGQKVAAEMPKINRETQQAIRSASSEAARAAWQDLRRAGTIFESQEEAGASTGESTHRLPSRRHAASTAAQTQAKQQSSANRQIQADSSQP
jgi:hypothetical protein